MMLRNGYSIMHVCVAFCDFSELFHRSNMPTVDQGKLN